MSLIQMDCPECATTMSLDPGFAGGVCRCSNCGTLMTVPAAGSAGSSRAARPSAPRAENPAAQAARPPASRAATTGQAVPVKKLKPDAPATRSSPKPGPTRDSHAAKKTATSSSSSAKTPAKQAKKSLATSRSLVLGAGGLGLSLLIAAGWWLVADMMSDGQDHAGFAESTLYDATASPRDIDALNVLGLPVRGETTVLLDYSAGSAAWRGAVASALALGMAHDDPERTVTLVPLNGNTSTSLDGEGVTSAALLELPSTGDADLAEYLDDHAGKQAHVIIITGQAIPRDDTGKALLEAAKPYPDMVVDVVMIDADSVALDDLVVQQQGRFVRLLASDVARWAE